MCSPLKQLRSSRKKRKLDNAATLPALMSNIDPGTEIKSPERKRVSPRYDSVPQPSTSIFKSTGATSSATNARNMDKMSKIERKKALKIEGERIRAKLSRVLPMSVGSSAFIQIASTSGSKHDERNESAEKTDDRHEHPPPPIAPGRRSLSPVKLDFHVQDETDLNLNLDNVKALVEKFRAGMAKGLRPGLVVPRMACLDGWEEKPVG